MMSAYSSTAPTPAPKQSTSNQPYEADQPTQRFVIGKIDAGIAVLISDSVHLIEFPSLLLPPGVGPGSIVNIACARNVAAEKAHAREFWDLQRDIFETFGANEPSPPKLRVRNTTQTSVTLEWDKLDLASASLISLSMYRNGQRLTTIPNPLTNTSTKLSGLQLDTDYSFHLVLKTTAGTFSSPIVKTKTHTIDNTTGISVCFGLIQPKELEQQAKDAVKEMGARWSDSLQIDTTHFVATSSASGANPNGGPGVEYQKAVQLSIPVVSPEWLLACHRQKKLVPISAYYLGQTNHAASLSSAELPLSASTSSPSSASVATARRPSAPSVAAPPPPPVVLEEPEAAPTPPPVQLEENVEEPPRDEEDEVVLSAPTSSAPAPAAAGKEDAEGDAASTKGVKSEVEQELDSEEREEEASSSVPTEEFGAEAQAEKEEEEKKVEEEKEAKPDAPGEELAEELEKKVNLTDDDAAAESSTAPVSAPEEADPEPAVTSAEVKDPVSAAKVEEDEGETDTPKASISLDDTEVKPDAPGEELASELAEDKKDDDEKKDEEEKKETEDEGETSLVDISL